MHKAEDVMPVRINWNRPTVSKNVVEDPPKGMDRLQLLALAKAASISKTVCDVSLGVNSKQVAHNDCEGDGALEAESMQLHSQINDSNVDVVDSTRNKSSEHVTPPIDGLDVTSRCIIKQRATIDHQREMEVREIIKSHVQKMEETVRNQREILKSKNEGIKREREGRVLQAGQEILREIHEGEVQASQRQLLLAQKHKQHEQRMNARNQMIKEAEKRRKELEEEEKKKMREKKELLGKMIQYLMDFKVKNDEMVDTMRKCKNKELLISKVCSETLKLRKYFEALEQFVNLCKVGEANNKYLQEAATIMQKAEAVIQSVCAEVANINAEHEKAIEEKAEKQKEESVKQPAAVSAPAIPVPAAPAPALAPAAPPASSHTSDLSDFADEASYKMYISLQEYLKNFDSSCEALVKDESVKKFRFNCQKAVNIPVNAIAPTSATHIQDKYLKLSKLISGQMVYVGNGSFSASTHPQGVAYCKSLLAKKFVYQGEMTVSSKPEAAFAIAAVIVALWTEFPDFGQLLLAHFYKECPYLVPVFMPQVEGQSNSDYYKTLGYHFSENGEVESHDKFLKRMSGIMRLYAAILVTHPRRHQRQPNPHGLALAWRWLACLLNLEPMPDICATLLYDFLDVTGNAMCNTYGQQFQKLLHLIAKEYFPKINTKTTVSSGPLVRLEVFLQKVLKQQGRIPPPSGILPPNFW